MATSTAIVNHMTLLAKQMERYAEMEAIVARNKAPALHYKMDASRALFKSSEDQLIAGRTDVAKLACEQQDAFDAMSVIEFESREIVRLPSRKQALGVERGNRVYIDEAGRMFPNGYVRRYRVDDLEYEVKIEVFDRTTPPMFVCECLNAIQQAKAGKCGRHAYMCSAKSNSEANAIRECVKFTRESFKEFKGISYKSSNK
jgi:hypothetical protein